mmetsp:Transcript_13006/g.26993  ORF Transcript_13006/g.26993 Transcript_13006/m.26993 type:complete len:82 (-) Transcript_13006:299-544(-)
MDLISYSNIFGAHWRDAFHQESNIVVKMMIYYVELGYPLDCPDVLVSGIFNIGFERNGFRRVLICSSWMTIEESAGGLRLM